MFDDILHSRQPFLFSGCGYVYSVSNSFSTVLAIITGIVTMFIVTCVGRSKVARIPYFVYCRKSAV